MSAIVAPLNSSICMVMIDDHCYQSRINACFLAPPALLIYLLFTRITNILLLLLIETTHIRILHPDIAAVGHLLCVLARIFGLGLACLLNRPKSTINSNNTNDDDDKKTSTYNWKSLFSFARIASGCGGKRLSGERNSVDEKRRLECEFAKVDDMTYDKDNKTSSLFRVECRLSCYKISKAYVIIIIIIIISCHC